ncbi:hypothetical protein B296_00027020 [Ensete ventricosum]|uniref:Uncharacterized protein n=1 Tax=Ensete ventricosum TaxID=4639 RepID=A0A426XEN4_ENSVE|nr:hypothetical protein B296_00027020 [Ensete ventricosum]
MIGNEDLPTGEERPPVGWLHIGMAACPWPIPHRGCRLQGQPPVVTFHMELVPAGTMPACKGDHLLARWMCKVALHANTTAANGAQRCRMHRGANGGPL